MQRLFRYVRRYWLRYAFGVVCTWATVSLLMAVPQLIKVAINSVERGQFNRLPRSLV